MRTLILFLFLAASALADSYVFSKDGKTATTGPRDLPSVGVRLDDGKAVLGLHGADDATRAACGWYRVVADQTKAAADQVASGSTYAIDKATARETKVFSTRTTLTPEQRLEQIFYAMPGKSDDERVSALVRAVAACVTGKVDQAVSVLIPAKKAQVEK